MSASRYALLIGNWDYQHPQFRALASPARDVRDLEAVLSDPRIGGFDHVEVLENETEKEIRNALDRFFSERSHSDLLVLYFSGHGIKDASGRFYFTAVDTDPKRPLVTGIPATFIHEVIQGCRSRRKVLLIDACFGGAVAKGLIVKSDPGITAEQMVGDASGLVIITATDSMTYAFESEQTTGHAQPSVFTRHLVHGLRTGEADVAHDGIVTIDELYSYVRDKVKHDTPHQVPRKWELEDAGELIIARNPRYQASLPPEIDEAVHHWMKETRLGSIDYLVALARNPRRRDVALETLRTLLADDSQMVRDRAREAISMICTPDLEPKATEDVRDEEESAFPRREVPEHRAAVQDTVEARPADQPAHADLNAHLNADKAPRAGRVALISMAHARLGIAVLVVVLVGTAIAVVYKTYFANGHPPQVVEPHAVIPAGSLAAHQGQRAEAVSATAEPKGYWFPVVGSFNSLDEARRFAATVPTLETKYAPEIHLSENGYYGVTLGGYLDAKEALNRVNFAKGLGFKDAYVFESPDWGGDLTYNELPLAPGSK